MPKNWEIVISPKRVKLLNRDNKLLNIFVKAPAKITAGDYYLKLILKDKEKVYKKTFKLNIKKINKLKFNLVKSLKYITEKFKVKFYIINRGNTKRNLNFISDNVSIDNDKLILNPFEKKKVILNCKLYKISQNPYINIFVESEKGNKYRMFNKRLVLLNHIEKSQKLKSVYSINYNYQNDNMDKYWQLKTFLKQKGYLSLQNNNFRLHYKNKSQLFQFGNEYFNKFIQLGKQNSKRLKFVYQYNLKKYKNIIYTNFNGEFGLGNYYRYKDKFYYLELNKNNYNINHYFKARIKSKDLIYNIKNYNKNNKNLYYLEIEKKLKNNDRFKTGLYLKDNNNIKKKYFRYINDKINYKMTYGYSLKNTDRYKKHNIIYINGNKNDNELLKLNYEYNNYFDKKNKRNLQMIYTKDSYRINLEFNDHLEKKDIKFKISKSIRTKQLNTLAIIDNYYGLRVGLENKFKYITKGQKIITFKGYYSYNFKKEKFNNNIKLNLSIPLKYKNNNNKNKFRLLKAVVKGKNKDLSGIVFDVNNQKVKTNKKGILSIKVDQNKTTTVKLVDLGSFKSKYYIKPKKHVIKDNYNGKEIEFNLVKLIKLKVKFQQNITFIDKYINRKNNELTYLRLYNNINEYIKKYEGEQEIYFNKIKPGNYKLEIKVLKSPFEYSIKKQDIMINSNNDIIFIEKSLKASNKHKENYKLNNLKIKKK